MNYTLCINGMTCSACSSRIEKKLNKYDKISKANVNLATNKASIVTEEKINLLEINKLVENLGYEVEKKKIEIDIEGMTCSSCSSRIEKQISKMDGVLKSNVNLTTNKGTFLVLKDVQTEKTIIQKIKNLGYEGKINKSKNLKDNDESLRKQSRKLFLSAILSLPLLLSMFDVMFDFTLIPNIFTNGYFQLGLASIVQFYCGWQFYKGAWINISHFSANMDVLVAMGTSAAYLFSIYNITQNGHLYFETSAVLITLILFGKYLEQRAKGKTTEAISKLLNLTPKEAVVLRNGKELIITTDEVIKDDIVLVKAGGKIPVDGVVIDGESYVDESMITGESKAVKKTIKSDLVGGTINSNGILKYKATKLGDESFLAQIVKIVEEAQGSKASIQRFADVISGYFVPTVIALSILTFVFWYNFSGDISIAIINMVAVLVIACPCALGLATPTSIMVGTGKGANEGILFKGGEHLENAQKITTVVFDKTGTITVGKPSVTQIDSEDKDKILQITASIEKYSEHPIAKAIIDFYKGDFLDVKNVKTVSGLGIEGEIDGKKVLVGSKKFIEKNISIPKSLNNGVSSNIYVSFDNKFIGMIKVSDEIKSTTKIAIQALKDMGIEVYMLTGDNLESAEYIGKQAGIDNIIAEVLPAEKAQKIKELQDKGKIVAMVGDGINDAPALVTADIGFAVGNGSDIAIESSDITLLRGDIMGVSKAIKLSQKTMRNIKQNLFWALIYNIIGIPIAAMGLLSPMIAGTAMAFSSVSVVSNSLRLKGIKL